MTKSRPSDYEVTERHVSTFLRRLENGGHPLEVYDLVDRLELDIVTEVFFGESADSQNGEQQPLRDAMDTVLLVNTARLLAG